MWCTFHLNQKRAKFLLKKTSPVCAENTIALLACFSVRLLALANILRVADHT